MNKKNPLQVAEAELPLHHGVARSRISEPLGAELRDPLLSLEVDVNQPEPIAVAIPPFEIVLRAPEEVTIHRHPVGSRSLKFLQVRTQKHDPIGVVYLAVVGYLV